MTLRTQHHKPVALLLVEDNPGDRRLIQEHLRETDRPHFSATVAESLAEAFRASGNNVDAILLDLNLPDSHGLTTLTRVREHAPQLPCIVLTGLADEEMGTRAIQQGADDYLTKDQLTPEMLRRAIVYSIQRHRAHRAYQRMTETHRLTLANISDAVIITDDDGQFTYVSGSTQHIFGYSDAEIREMGSIDQLLGKQFIDDHPLHDRAEIANVEHPITDQQGRRHDLLVNIKRVDIYGGTVLYTCRDVTERVRAERELKSSQQRLQAIFDNSLDAILLADDDARYVEANDAACEMFGMAHDELVGRGLWDITPDADRDQAQAAWNAFLQQGHDSGDFQIVRADGRQRDVEFRAVAHIQPGLHLSILRDVTARKQAERELVMSQRFTQSVLDSLDANIAVVDEEGWIISTNAQWDQYSRDNGEPDLSRTGVGQKYLDVCRAASSQGAEEAPHALAGIRAVLSGEQSSFDLEYPSPDPDARDRWYLLHVAPFSGSEPGVVVAHLDITDRKRAESDLLEHVDRLTAVNQLEWDLTTQSAPEQIHARTAAAITDLIPDLSDVSISRFEAETERIHWEYALRDGEALPVDEAPPRPLQPEGHGLRSDVIRRGEPMIVDDLRATSYEAPTLHEPPPDDSQARSALLAPMASQGEVVGVIQAHSRAPNRFTEAEQELLALIANTTAVSLDNVQLLGDLQSANEQLRQAYDKTIGGWAKALELKDKETEGHTERTAEWTLKLARWFAMGEDDLQHVYRGALLHDIGKMGVPDAILHKPGKLDDDEWEVMKQHPAHAYELLKSIDFLHPALAIPHCHHERWDGAGYPQGLAGEQIPLEARIFAVVDAYDAMTNDRPYRDALPHDEAVRRLRENAGTQFDPDVVKAFIAMMDEDASSLPCGT
ncbi:MAG: PAS domain S-box protein [Candidatus Bipolaricaulia bacterium]